jgi:NhaA family Na+:H+ antiporter
MKLDPPVDSGRDHVLGNPEAAITLVEYGSYACPYCHAVHSVIADLRDRFGDRLRYVFRHRPITDSDEAQRAAELAEYASEATGRFWEVHDALMKRGPTFVPADFQRIEAEFNLPPNGRADAPASHTATLRVRDDAESARRSGAFVTPTFFINNRRYEGPWDESTLS